MNSDQFFDAYDEAPNLRSAEFSDLEITEVRDDFIFDGYAAVFGEPTDLGDFTEEIRHGAFRKVLAKGGNVPLLVEHNREQLLATTRSGRLRLSEETKGLRVSANVPITDLSKRVKTLYDSGDMTGMSFGFICGRGNSDRQMRNGKPHRILKSFNRLLDVTTTWDPAYASAEAQFRTMAFASPGSAEPGRDHLLGVYPTQPDEPAAGEEETEETRSTEGDDSGVSRPLLAARKRRLQLLSLTLEGDEDDAWR